VCVETPNTNEYSHANVVEQVHGLIYKNNLNYYCVVSFFVHRK